MRGASVSVKLPHSRQAADGAGAGIEILVGAPEREIHAVGVERVLGPRVVLRRSLQYALARRTLTAVAANRLAAATTAAVTPARWRARW